MNWEDKLNGKIQKDKEDRKELEQKVQEEKKKMEEQQKQKEKIDFFNEILVPTFNELLEKFSKGYQTEIKQQADLKELGLTIKVQHDNGNFTFKVMIKEDKLFYEQSGENSKKSSGESRTKTLVGNEFISPDGNYLTIKKEQIQEECVEAFLKFFED